jgi:hypothetical protein
MRAARRGAATGAWSPTADSEERGRSSKGPFLVFNRKSQPLKANRTADTSPGVDGISFTVHPRAVFDLPSALGQSASCRPSPGRHSRRRQPRRHVILGAIRSREPRRAREDGFRMALFCVPALLVLGVIFIDAVGAVAMGRRPRAAACSAVQRVRWTWSPGPTGSAVAGAGATAAKVASRCRMRGGSVLCSRRRGKTGRGPPRCPKVRLEAGSVGDKLELPRGHGAVARRPERPVPWGTMPSVTSAAGATWPSSASTRRCAAARTSRDSAA